MRGNDKVIAVLNTFLADELTAISQYIVHSEMCANWQYAKLHDATEKRAIEEMKHAEKLIARILFLEGKPIVSQLNKISIGATVEEQLKNDLAAEVGAIKGYNDGIKTCLEVGDGGSPRADRGQPRGRRGTSGLARSAGRPDHTNGAAELPALADRLRNTTTLVVWAQRAAPTNNLTRSPKRRDGWCSTHPSLLFGF